MTPVKPQVSKLMAEKSCQVGFNMLRRLYNHERLLSEASFSYVLTFRMYVISNILSV
jgi:hypothetical protein